MFSLLRAGSWTADHPQMLRAFNCTSERERLHMCTNSKSNSNAGVNVATISTDPASTTGGTPLGAAKGNPFSQVSYQSQM